MRRWLLPGLVVGLLVALTLGQVAQSAESDPSTKSTKKTRRARVPKPPPATVEQREVARLFVEDRASDAMDLGVQNPAALIPFFERIYRSQLPDGVEESERTVRVLQYGDSHTAADDWASAVRGVLQPKFGDGGVGFIQAGHPYDGFRRTDAKGTQSRGWQPHGLLNREGDGLYGMAGVRLETDRPGETLTLDADGTAVELYFWKQSGGGRIAISDNGTALATLDTGGETGPGFWRQVLPAGPHHLELRTQDEAPVIVFGWTVEKGHGLTWEPFGINGGQADLLLLWNEPLLRAQLARRDPGLIVLAYGTNEARRSDWNVESYREMLRNVLRRFRQAAPLASILVIGAPDQSLRARRSIMPVEGVDRIDTAQREAALAEGCAFWNLRVAMGGRGSMKQWVTAGLAQGDFVHLTGPGYRLWGESLAQLLLQNYSVYGTVRSQVFGKSEHGSPLKTH